MKHSTPEQIHRTTRASSESEPLNPIGRLALRLSSIRYKIILPYFFLTLTVAVMGIYIATRLIANSVDERLTNQLLEAGRVVGDGIVRQEADNLESLRPLTGTIGVAEAIEAGDVDGLLVLIEVQAYSDNLDSLIVLNGAGDLVLRLDALRISNSEVIDNYAITTDDNNYANTEMGHLVVPILAGVKEGESDKFSAIIQTGDGPILYTSAPVLTYLENGSTTLSGVILVGMKINRLLPRLKSEALADIVLYSVSGPPIGSTVPDWQETAQLSELTMSQDFYDQAFTTSNETPIEVGVTLFERKYRMAASQLRVNGEEVGVLSVLLPSSFVVSTLSTSRTSFVIVFSAAMFLVVIIGFAIGQRIVRPIFELSRLAKIVSTGNLDAQAQVMSKDELGSLTHTFNNMISQLKDSLYATEEENAKSQAILSSIADGVLVRNRQGDILLMNDAARELLNVDEAFDPLAIDNLMIEHASAVPFRLEIGKRTISMSMASVELDEGNTHKTLLGDVMVFRDITREAIAERTKDNFLNQIGHELRTPMTSIKGYSDILLQGGDRLSPEMKNKALTTLNEQAGILTGLINNMIDLTAIQTGDITLHCEDINIIDIIAESIEKRRKEMEKAGLTPYFYTDNPLQILSVDVYRMQQTIDAVLHNAILFSPSGGRIEISLRESGDQVCLSISDPGVGIAENEMPHLFDRFFRGNPVNADGSPIDVRGMGQGLYVVQAIMQAHDGTVNVESEVGDGTTVRLCLPIK